MPEHADMAAVDPRVLSEKLKRRTRDLRVSLRGFVRGSAAGTSRARIVEPKHGKSRPRQCVGKCGKHAEAEDIFISRLCTASSQQDDRRVRSS